MGGLLATYFPVNLVTKEHVLPFLQYSDYLNFFPIFDLLTYQFMCFMTLKCEHSLLFSDYIFPYFLCLLDLGIYRCGYNML